MPNSWRQKDESRDWFAETEDGGVLLEALYEAPGHYRAVVHAPGGRITSDGAMQLATAQRWAKAVAVDALKAEQEKVNAIGEG